MKPGTRTEGPASLKLTFCQAVPAPMRGKVREVSKVKVAQGHRGQGHASALMRKVCQEADLNHMALLLEVEPFDDEPLTTEQLAYWYERLGFKVIQPSPLVMVRPAYQ